MKFYCITNIFDLRSFDNETATLSNFFKIWTEMHIVSLFFLNQKNIATPILIIHLKFTVVHYANLNSSSKNKPFLNYGLLNMLSRYFRFHIFSQKLYEKLLFFNTNLQNSCQVVVYYRIIGCRILWYWNGGTLNTTEYLKKMVSFI